MVDVGAPVVPFDEVKRLFPDRAITKVTTYEGLVDGRPVFFRAGTPKPEGFQVTIRVGERTEGSYGRSVVDGVGYTCIRRGRCYLIPSDKLQCWLREKFSQKTVDVYLDIEQEVLMSGELPPFPVSQFGGRKPSSP